MYEFNINFYLYYNEFNKNVKIEQFISFSPQNKQLHEQYSRL